MEVSLNNVQQSLVSSWNDLIELLNDSVESGGTVNVDMFDLEERLINLRNSVAFVACIVDPDSGISNAGDKEAGYIKTFEY